MCVVCIVSVGRSQAIATRHRGKRTKELTQASLKKKLSSMTKTLKVTTRDAAQYEVCAFIALGLRGAG